MQKFDDVTLLITHYNRSASLERLLKAFRDLGVEFADTVVSDDCSKPEHIRKMQELQQDYVFRLITTPKNGGLGHNINKGQRAVTTEYTLYVQEDFVPLSPCPEKLTQALDLLNERPELDIARFYAYFRYPSLKPYKNGFSEMFYDPWSLDHTKFYMYSDHPHLRRKNFLEKFGNYPEGIDVNRTEFGMCLSFIKRKGKALFYNGIYEVFDQKNTSDEPSTFYRADWRQSNNPLLLAVRAVYLKFRLLKNTLQLMKTPADEK